MIHLQNFTKPDMIGVTASGLCAVHCMATPFIFIAKASSVACCVDAPAWWHLIDYLFLVIAFAAIYYAVKTSSKSWVKFGLWASWGTLAVTILNETFETGFFPEEFVYLPAIAIVGLHVYNHRYCQCATESTTE